MNTSNILLAALAFILQVTQGYSVAVHKPARRTKRTIFQMCDLIQRHTNRNCLDYNDYGCFCGWGNAGSGRTALDGVDECCRVHDQCYGEVTCLWFYPQMVGYNVHCSEDSQCECQDSPFRSPCARSVCLCDVQFGECLGRHRYNVLYRKYDWHLCGSTGNEE